MKQDFEDLMRGNPLKLDTLDEQIVYDQLSKSQNAVWSLLLASGYLKVMGQEFSEKAGRYTLTSNRESGFGRYDVTLEPENPGKDDGIILEFKVFQPKKEKCLENTVATALQQIEEKKYETYLIMKGNRKENIRKYGFAFSGKKVLIGRK